MGQATPFDRTYYERFYLDPKTRVTTVEGVARLARFVCHYLQYLELPVHRVLDIGCGLGWWREPLAHHYPAASYTGVEVSSYLCASFGWQSGSVVDYRADEPFDLVICHGVLQYLDESQARRALDNLARLCQGALFLEVLTQEDWQHNCDQSTTDGDTHLRPAKWYRSRLKRHFTNCGGGVFLAANASVVLYELEKAE